MNNRKIVVLTKFFKGELNPFDGSALECALQSGSKDITVLSMSPMSAFSAFSALTRLGVKGIFISDAMYAGSDTIATSYILAEALKRLKPDLIFCGRQSVDGDTAQVPPMLSHRLGYSIQTQVVDIDGECVVKRSGKKVFPTKNTVLTFERSKTLRFPSIFSKAGEVEIWDNQSLGLDGALCGLKGSPTRVKRSYESEVGRRFCSFIHRTELDACIRQALEKKQVEKVCSLGEKLDVVAYVGNLKTLAEN